MTTISLKAGWNEVLYTGITQSVEAAFASILPYLEVVYYWDGSSWVIPTTMVTGNYYSIKVSQDCEWTFEVFEPPFTEITEIVAPSSAKAGDWVDVTIRVKNIWTGWVHVRTYGIYDSEETFIDFTDWIPAGSTHEYGGAFIMPDRAVTIHAYTYYEDEDGYWRSDDEAEKPVSLAAPPEVYAGTIIGIELEHDGVQEGLPVYNIPQGQTARVHVWGRNDMATVQRLGIHWLVYDPDGKVVEDYEDWSFLGYRQGADHKFSGGYFNLNKQGTYTINIALSMNPADPEIVDDYYGNLCTVALAVPEPQFAGFGITEYTKR